MSNFTQIVSINANRETKNLSLKVAVTSTGKSIYSGRFYWSTGRKDKDGNREYGNLSFYTWDERIYNLFKDNPTESFLIEANLYPDDWTDKKGITHKQFKACIVAASIHKWERKNSIAHWQDENK